MDTRIIEVRKNISIPFDLITGKGGYTYNIQNIDFIPDEVVIKNIVFTLANPLAPDNSTTSIYTDLVSDFIGSFSDVPPGNFTMPNLTFTLKRPVNRLFKFDILAASDNTNDNDMVDFARTGDLTIHLEFLKYRHF